MQKSGPSQQNIRFSIGAKLIIIITILVLVSLGSITALVSWLVRQDLQITAEVTNLEVNRHSSNEAEYTFANLRANSQLIIQTINAAGVDTELSHTAVGFFFEQNPQIAMLTYTIDDGPRQFLINEWFFLSRAIDLSLIATYDEIYLGEISRAARGETLLLNAAPIFDYPLLTLFFPWHQGGGAVIFSAERMSDTFGFGTNQSFMINDSGDVLIHSDSDLVKSGANISNRNFVQAIRENPLRNLQISYTDDNIRYFGAFTKLDIGASIVITSIEYDRVFEGLHETTLRNIYLTAAILSISIMFIYFFSKNISLPLKALAQAARNIEGGSFEVNLKSKRQDEIGVLTHSFHNMSTALNIFGKFTNKDLAVRAMRGELRPGGLAKHATIFFSDIRGFTEKSENFIKVFGKDASDKTVFWLNNYLTRMIECVEKTGGVVDKFIGDSVMAHWGTAYTSGKASQDALNCIRAALMMRTELIKINQLRQPKNEENPEITIGMGINTGIVTAGQIGSDLRMEYTVIGSPVNIASRTEGLNKPMNTDILITEDTWNLVREKVITEEMPSVILQGMDKPTRLYAVIRLSEDLDGPNNLLELRKLLGLKTPDLSKLDEFVQKGKYEILEQFAGSSNG